MKRSVVAVAVFGVGAACLSLAAQQPAALPPVRDIQQLRDNL